MLSLKPGTGAVDIVNELFGEGKIATDVFQFYEI